MKTTILLLLLVLVLVSFLKRKSRKTTNSPRPAIISKSKKDQALDEVLNDIVREERRVGMTETSLLRIGTLLDVVIPPSNISEKSYDSCFFVQIIKRWGEESEYPPIDPLFQKLLEEGFCREVIIRQFVSRERTLSAMRSAFESFGKGYTEVALSATEILIYYLENKEKLSEKNWFLLNTKPKEENLQISDFRLVDIWNRDGKPFIYTLPVTDWGVILGSSVGSESSFFIPIPRQHAVLFERMTVGVV